MKMETSLVFIALSLLAGALIPFQSAINAQLSIALKSPYYTALIVFLVAAAGLLMCIILCGFGIPPVKQFSLAPSWSFLGGILGGTYILLIVICAPRIGIGNVTVMVLAGQVVAAILIDQFGWLHAQVHLLNWQRVIGLLLLLMGVYLVKKF